MSKKILILSLPTGSEYAVDLELKRTLYEYCSRHHITMSIRNVNDEVSVLDLPSLISCLEGHSTYEQALPEEAAAETLPDFLVTTNALARARNLKDAIIARLIHNNYNDGSYEEKTISLSEVSDSWNTGLSRGGLSRHLKNAGEELVNRGYQVESSNGRYRVLA